MICVGVCQRQNDPELTFSCTHEQKGSLIHRANELDVVFMRPKHALPIRTMILFVPWLADGAKTPVRHDS